AERLAPAADGAALAVKLGPALLRARFADADGWTLFAEALMLLGRRVEAEMVDGFGAALTSSDAPAPAARTEAVENEMARKYPPTPEGVLAITEESMPRLSLTLGEALRALGAGGVRVYLHPSGGPEMYQVSPSELVLGAGALAAFGPAELTYLCALALALGPRGGAL